MTAQLIQKQPLNAAPECALCLRMASHVTNLTAALVGLVRPLVRHQLTDDECELKGLPVGTSEPAVFCTPLPSASPWRLDLWTEADDNTRQACLHLRILGCDVEVWYHAGR